MPVVASETNDIAPRRLFMALSAQRGFLFDTRESTVVENHYTSLDFRVGWQTDDYRRNIYESLFRYPQYGIGFYFGQMNSIVIGNDQQQGLGMPVALYGFFASPIIRNEWFRFNYDFSVGIADNFNTYDWQDRPYNVFVSTKKNIYINLSLTTSFAIFERSALNLGVSLQHFSNTSLKKPNTGVNLLSGTLSYQAGFFKHNEKNYSRISLEPHKKTWELQFSWANGVRRLDADFNFNQPNESKIWYSTSLSTAILRQTSHRRKFGAGFDVFYFDWGRYVKEERMKAQNIKENSTLSDNMALGVFLTHEVFFNKFGIVTNLGFYTHERIGDRPKNLWIYERLGIFYQVNSNISFVASIKAHLLIADYAELTARYSINLKN